jgi:DnaJ-domain-containing protein 1
MLPVLLLLAALFALLFFTRVGAAYRERLLAHWPAVLLASAALFAVARGGIWPAATLALLAVLAWLIWPRLAPSSRQARTPADDRADAEARALLGLGNEATAAEIRAAYRVKMAQAHPDRGGAHADAAQLTAARDRLLKNTRR